MKENSIIEAMAEAKRFLKRVETLMNDPYDWPNLRLGIGSANTGSVKRASMDLTRALAKMRRS